MLDAPSHDLLPLCMMTRTPPDATRYEMLAKHLQGESREPLYRQVASAFERWMEEGSLPPGAKLPSERQLMEWLKVSRRTVRTALGELVASGRLGSTHGLGYYVQEAKGQQRLRFMVPDSFAPDPLGQRSVYFDWFRDGEAVEEVDLNYLYIPGAEGLRRLLLDPPPGYDGILIFRPTPDWLKVLFEVPPEVLLRERLPIVVVNRDVVPEVTHYVSADHFSQMQFATRQLIEAGHRRIAYLGGDHQESYLRRTWEGYRAALEEAGIPANPRDELLLGCREIEEIRRQIDAFLQKREFTGLVIGGGAFLSPFEQVYLRSGLAIPEDFSVVASVERSMLETLTVRWSSWIFPSEQVARRSIQALAQIRRGELRGPVRELLPPIQEPGATCRPPGN